MGRPRLTAAVKARRGTLRPVRERQTRKREPAAVEVPVPTRDYLGIAAGYMAGVLSGEIVTGRWTRLAVERQDRDLRRAADDPSWPFVFSAEHAADVCKFQRHAHAGPGTRSLAIGQPWRRFMFVSNL